MTELPSPEQVGTATTWFTTQAGITATVLAFVCIAEAIGLVWAIRACRKALGDANEKSHAHWSSKTGEMQEAWGKRIDQFRADVKEAFGQNDEIADKVVDALGKLQVEIARMSGRNDRG
jgi:uncharacterized protein YjbJ (UPF0337 family)